MFNDLHTFVTLEVELGTNDLNKMYLKQSHANSHRLVCVTGSLITDTLCISPNCSKAARSDSSVVCLILTHETSVNNKYRCCRS
jgi:hypothetical protein